MSMRLLTIVLGVLGLVASLGALAGAGGDAGDEVLTSFYANGQAKETARFVDGVRSGECTRWYQDGTLKAEGAFDGGKMIGEWIWLTPEGERDQKRCGSYEKGRRISG